MKVDANECIPAIVLCAVVGRTVSCSKQSGQEFGVRMQWKIVSADEAVASSVLSQTNQHISASSQQTTMSWSSLSLL